MRKVHLIIVKTLTGWENMIKKGEIVGGGEDRKSYQKDLQLDTDVSSKFLDLLGGIYPLLN